MKSDIRSLRGICLIGNEFFVILCMCVNIGALLSQKSERLDYRPGIVIGTHISGNAHGEIYDLYGSLYNGKSLFSFGPSIQKRTNMICGARTAFSYMITDCDDFSPLTGFTNCDKLQLYFFSYLQYFHKSSLSYAAIKREEARTQRIDHYEIDFNKIRLSTAEMGLGFGLNTKLNKRVVWSNYIGFSMYYHIQCMKGMYADRIAPALIIGTSMGVNFL